MGRTISQSGIESAVRGSVKAVRELTLEEESRFDSLTGDEYAKLFDIPESPIAYEDVEPHLQEYKRITERFVAVVEGMGEKAREFEDDPFLITDRQFDLWFNTLCERVVPKLLTCFEGSKSDRMELRRSQALRLIKLVTESARHMIGVPSFIRVYCLELPLLFPTQRKEIANIGARMAAIRYLELLSNRLYKVLTDESHPIDTSKEALEGALQLRRVATILSR